MLSILPRGLLAFRYSAISIKIPAGLFCRLWQAGYKYLYGNVEIQDEHWKVVLPDIKSYSKVIAIKTVEVLVQWHTNRQEEKGEHGKRPIHDPFLYDKGGPVEQWGKNYLFDTGTWGNWIARFGGKWNWTHYLIAYIK